MNDSREVVSLAAFYNIEKQSVQMKTYWSFLLLLLLLASATFVQSSSPYNCIGIGSYDITGPAADVNMMGYANPSQKAAGVHLRLRARAFIVAEASMKSDGERVVFVNLDACMASMAVTLRVLSRLKERFNMTFPIVPQIFDVVLWNKM